MSILLFQRYKFISAEKRREQGDCIKRLDDIPGAPYSQQAIVLDDVFLQASLSEIVSNTHSGVWAPKDVLHAYGRQALQAHTQSNCLTEILLLQAERDAYTLSQSITSASLSGAKLKTLFPLAGVPVSLKDSVAIAGSQSCIGYASFATHPPAASHAPLVSLLLDAGALLLAKTTVPTTLLSFESASALHGRTLNPHNHAYSPGGSSGGEGALLALGGSRIGIGTDVAGSVRVPAHYCGIVSMKSSVGRFPKADVKSAMPGQEGVPGICAPMAQTVEDLDAFWKAVMSMKPWKYDYTVLNMPWRKIELSKKVRFGVMWDDGVVPLSPACKRALQIVIDSLVAAGHEVSDFSPPDPFEGYLISAQLLLADGNATVHEPLLPFEPTDPGMQQSSFWFSLPRFVQRIYAFFVRHILRDLTYATVLEAVHKKSILEHFKLVAKREAYRNRWFQAWDESGLDFLLTAPNALPAVPHGGMKRGWKSCGYTMIFNLLDYTAGVLPITRVSSSLDSLLPTPAHRRNTIAKQAFAMYDAQKMDGLPVGVQVIGRRLEEEKVLEGLKLVVRATKDHGTPYA